MTQLTIDYSELEHLIEISCAEFLNDQIGMTIGIIKNGILPAFLISEYLNISTTFLKYNTRQEMWFSHYNEIQEINDLKNNKKCVLLCVDFVSSENEFIVIQAQKFLNELEIPFKTFALFAKTDCSVDINYFIPCSENPNFIWQKASNHQKLIKKENGVDLAF